MASDDDLRLKETCLHLKNYFRTKDGEKSATLTQITAPSAERDDHNIVLKKKKKRKSPIFPPKMCPNRRVAVKSAQITRKWVKIAENNDY
jgi:hypothetical protein